MIPYFRSAGFIAGLLLIATLSGCATNPVEQSAEAENTGIKPFETPAGEASYHLLLAEMALEREQFAVAAREYRKAAELSDDPEIAQRAVSLSMQMGLYSDALAGARRWAELEPDNPAAHQQLARLYLRDNKLKAAVASFEKLLSLNEGAEEDAFLPVTGILLEEGDHQRAITVMTRLVDRHQSVGAAHYGLALMAMQADDLERAEREILESQRLRPEWDQAGLLYARILVSRGETEAGLLLAADIARASADPSLRLDYALLLANLDREGEARLELDLLLEEHPRMASALRAAGLLELRRGDLDAAQLHFTSLLATGRSTWEAFFYLGTIAEQRAQTVRAVRYYTQVRDGDLAVAAQVRAAALLSKMGEHERAVEQLLEIASESPRYDAELSIAAGEMLADRGDAVRALEIFDAVLMRHAGHRAARFARAFLYERIDDVDTAIAELRLLLRESPDDPIALNALGYTLADRTDRYREAEKLIRRAIELDPDNPAIIDSMGWISYRRGRLDEALTHLRLAYTLARDTEIAAHLAEVLWAAGQTDEAETVLQEALAEHPDDAALLKAIELLGL